MLVHTLTLTGGKICRKLDRVFLSEGLPWHIRPEWNAIYLTPAANNENIPAPQSCQRSVSQATLIGPLQKGKWQLFGVESGSLGKHIAFTGRRNIEKNGDAYEFSTDISAVLLAGAHHSGNTTGACREFVPLRLTLAETKSDNTKKTIRAVLLPPPPPRERNHGVCRALPQTSGQAAIEIPPGNYRLIGEFIRSVEIYTQETPAKSAKDSANTGAQQPVK